MNRTLAELTDLAAKVSDIYAERNHIKRDADWTILKLQEELGELTAEHLRLSGRGRLKDQSEAAIIEARENEAADLLAMLLLYARQHDIDLDAALQRKWFRYLT
jgi:NTP pyrophosphatase (non-canonical NTP hydrolase)